MPVFNVSYNKELLIVPGQESIVLAEVLQNFKVRQEEGFCHLSCMPCTRQSFRLSNSFTIVTSRCNESPASSSAADKSPESSNKRSVAARSLLGETT